MTISSYLYDAEGADQQVDLSAETIVTLGERNLLWIDVTGRDEGELNRVAETLKLDPDSLATLRDARHGQLESFGPYVQLAIETAPAFDPEAEGSPSTPHTRLDLLIDKAWLLTVHDEAVPFIDAFRTQDRAETTIGALTTHDLAASLLDMHLEAYFKEIARIEGLVDKVDEQALTRPSSKTLLGRMVSLRRRVSRLRNLLIGQRAVFYGLSRPDLQIVAEAGASPHFEVLANRFERAIDEIEHTRDLVTGSFELFASRTAQQTNELVKVLTFLTAIIGFCAAIAGVFGMNFETDIFATGDAGFYTTIGGLLLITLALWVTARRKGWL